MGRQAELSERYETIRAGYLFESLNKQLIFHLLNILTEEYNQTFDL
jgi:hypothetical protein